MIAFLLEITSLIMHDITFAEFRLRLETFGTAFDAENYNLLSCLNQYLNYEFQTSGQNRNAVDHYQFNGVHIVKFSSGSAEIFRSKVATIK